MCVCPVQVDCGTFLSLMPCLIPTVLRSPSVPYHSSLVHPCVRVSFLEHTVHESKKERKKGKKVRSTSKAVQKSRCPVFVSGQLYELVENNEKWNFVNFH